MYPTAEVADVRAADAYRPRPWVTAVIDGRYRDAHRAATATTRAGCSDRNPVTAFNDSARTVRPARVAPATMDASPAATGAVASKSSWRIDTTLTPRSRRVPRSGPTVARPALRVGTAFSAMVCMTSSRDCTAGRAPVPMAMASALRVPVKTVHWLDVAFICCFRAACVDPRR